MSIDSVDTFLDVLRRVQVLPPDQVDEVARELAPHYDDAPALANYLMEIDWLTAFQVEALFQDRWDELMIGPYCVLERLGEGGVSEVFKAWDTVKGRIVALKVLRRHLMSATDAGRQFNRELQAVTRLSHPNVIKTFDAAQVGNFHYFAMECVEGMDLHKFVQQSGPLPVDQAADYTRQVAQGLQHAHQLGLVHRDIKPANLFLLHPPAPGTSPGLPRRGPDPIVKILDWGLARVRLGPGESYEALGLDMEAEKGMLIGTADYIAPEQTRDASIVDIRADVYSLGCTLYFLLTGRPVFPGNSLMQKVLQHQQEPPPSVQALRPEVPAELDAVLQKMLAKRPEDRFQIPLLVVAPLRHFAQPFSAPGSVVRPPSSASLTRPVSSYGLGRPASSAHLDPSGSSPKIRRPGSNPGAGPVPHGSSS
jgi:serine/threonine-protein kinase